ncbi:MAG TPA: ester cyclase [Ktedonobacteraceae bacterium]|nr:ester cyclase [Ktedonobacteraceae bacterium]
MSMEEDKAISRRFYDEVINHGHLAALDELLASDCEGFKAAGAYGASNREHFKHLLAFALHTFPDCQHTIHAWHAEKDIVVTSFCLCGRQTGEYLGVPGVEKQFRATGSDTFHLVDGKIREHWVDLDTLHLGRQIAAMVPLDVDSAYEV